MLIRDKIVVIYCHILLIKHCELNLDRFIMLQIKY